MSVCFRLPLITSVSGVRPSMPATSAPIADHPRNCRRGHNIPVGCGTTGTLRRRRPDVLRGPVPGAPSCPLAYACTSGCRLSRRLAETAANLRAVGDIILGPRTAPTIPTAIILDVVRPTTDPPAWRARRSQLSGRAWEALVARGARPGPPDLSSPTHPVSMEEAEAAHENEPRPPCSGCHGRR